MDWLTALSDAAYGALNGISGRSWLVDTLISLPVDNALVKAGPVGAAFVYAWFSARDEQETKRRRALLIVTLAALVMVLGATKTLGKDVFLPRPFVQSQQAYHLEGQRLVESRKLDYRVPQHGVAKHRFEALGKGDVVENDLVSFPSDHAGFFFALALGIFLACRRAGIVALAWTVFAILLSRVVTGLHSPLDIVSGAAIGAAILLALQWLAGRFGRRVLDPVAEWTIRRPALASALMFIAVFEATNALENARQLGSTAAEVVKAVRGR
jgi:membrane-associated phospholipid phosphatase